MAGVEWTHEAHVNAPPAAVFAWLSDFRSDDHERPGFRRGAGIPLDKPSDSNREVLHQQGDVIKIKDKGGRSSMEFDVTLKRDTNTILIHGPRGYEATWAAEPAGDGTRLVLTGRMAPGGLMGFMMRFFAAGFKKQMAQDFAGHLQDLKEEVEAMKA